jgi:peptide/nickel transport system permease protein
MVNENPPGEEALEKEKQGLLDGGNGNLARGNETRWTKLRRHAPAFWRITKYLSVRAAGILAAIFSGIFITILIADKPSIISMMDSGSGAIISRGMIAGNIEQEAFEQAKKDMPSKFCMWCEWTPEEETLWWNTLNRASEKFGLNLPFLPRELLWTGRAMLFDLGHNVQAAGYKGAVYGKPTAAAVILSALPRTLLMAGMAFLLLFFTGIPLSLYLFRKHGSLQDRLLTLLAPLSAIPSWVLGMVLVLIFAVGLHLLPPSGMFDPSYPRLAWKSVPQVILHMILPVMAIFLSLFFQLLYTWKTFFLTFAGEDYVELAKAKGLPQKQMERQYILRPTVTYIITSFAMLVATFWQLSIALEYIFNWPGIGKVFISSLPNLNGEVPSAGIMVLVVEIVVLFAYILGGTAFVLDIIYALVDPRFRIGIEDQTVRGASIKKWRPFGRDRKAGERQPWRTGGTRARIPKPARMGARAWLGQVYRQARKSTSSLKPFLMELIHYPSAIFGLVVILALVGGSIKAVTIFPFKSLGSVWYEQDLSGRAVIPRIAKPTWINYFRKDPLPPSIFMGSDKGTAEKVIQENESGEGKHISITFNIDYPYGGFPSDLRLYFNSKYSLKRPFASLTWLTPDGREMILDNISPETSKPYSFITDMLPARLLSNFPHWQEWFEFAPANSGSIGTSPSDLLFADPSADAAKVLPGKYTLKLDIYTFEENSDVDAELDLLGQVYGLAGTDYLRRELIVPLLWGMPFALALGLIGALLTTLLSMTLAAAGVFFGGWFDQAIQRSIEGVMMLPVVAIGVIGFINYNLSIWVFLALIALLNVFGSPTKSFRAALLQIKDNPYIEWARASGASNFHIIRHYFLPNILPMFVPQIVALIPSYVFLEATLGIFGVKSQYPTWGRVIYDALRYGGLFGSSYWVFEPIALLLLTGLAFAMLGFALERILNPRLRTA